MSAVFWFVTFSARGYELSYSLAFVDLKITTARLPTVKTTHDAAPAKRIAPNTHLNEWLPLIGR